MVESENVNKCLSLLCKSVCSNLAVFVVVIMLS